MGRRFTSRLVKLIPALQLDSLRLVSRQHAGVRQEVLARYIFDAVDPGSVSIPWSRLTSDLHAKDPAVLSGLLTPFFGVTRELVDNRRMEGLGLRPGIRVAALEARAPGRRGRVTRPALPLLPPEHDVGEDMPRYVGSDIPPLLREIDLELVDSVIEGLDPTDSEYKTDWKLLSNLRTAVRQYGGLPNALTMQPSGRLGAKEGRQFHLIPLPRHLRHRLLAPLGWYDVDIKAAHPSIWLSLGKGWGFRTDQLAHYVQCRDEMHRSWMAVTGLQDPSVFKILVTSMLYGSALSTHPRRAIGNALGYEAAAKWIALPDVIALHQEIQAGLQFIHRTALFEIANYEYPDDVGYGSIANRVNRLISMDRKPSSVVSHILTGFERWAMDVVIPMLPAGILRTMIFDGFIVSSALSDQQVALFSKAIRERSIAEFRFTLDLSFKVTPFAHQTR